MNNIYSKVHQSLTKENTQLSKMALGILEDNSYNLQSIQEENNTFHFKFKDRGILIPTLMYEYLIVFIEKRLGCKFIVDPMFADQRVWYEILKRIV